MKNLIRHSLVVCTVLLFVLSSYSQGLYWATTDIKGFETLGKDMADDATDGKASNKQTSNDSNAQDTTGKKDTSTTKTPSIKVYSKFDFVPGEKIVGVEDFMQGEIGDFPAGWNTNASAEIVTIDGKPGRWLMFTKAGIFVPEFTHKLPDNFTFEFDLLCSSPFNPSGITSFYTSLVELSNPSQPLIWQNSNNVYSTSVFPSSGDELSTSTSESRKNAVSEPENSTQTKQFSATKSNPVHVSIWRQNERVRVYLNDEKTWDVPKAMVPGAKFNAIVFHIQYVNGPSRYYINNLRLAVGAPDTRNKLLTEGKWVTHGILFDVNSDKIKGESYGTLKSIATVLKENADLKVKIVGHTDSDGDDAKNLDLSKRRAASVKSMLAAEFGIDAARMETDGMGESKPIDKNDNPAGKANNRRVEFVKL
jgi:outer membrane protein OmpA-like peptidoglycan-associated protein